jgi:multidrug efflux system outer membrane protein
LRLSIARENAALQKRSLEITERLFKHGNDSELDVQQAKSQYLGTLATIPQLEGSLRQTQNALSVLLARPPGPLPEMADGREHDPAGGTGRRRRPAGRSAAPPPGRAGGRDATGGPVRADRGQRG